MRGGGRVFEAEAFDGLLEFIAEDAIVVTDDVLCRRVEVKRLTKLLDGPFRMRLGGDTPVQDFSPVV
jgi:hypothetical protein